MSASSPPPLLFGRAVVSLHCVGVGGMGLGPLAIFLAQLGYRVTGEDDAPTAAMRRQLERAGVTFTAVGALPPATDLVIVSSAIGPAHPAQQAAQARKIPLARRGEVLAEVVRDRRLVAICGSHGKTTTTAMLVAALRQANFPAGYVLGGLFNDDGWAPAQVGGNEWVVAEIDESDGTIECFAPAITVVVNLDWDHPDRYGTWAQLEEVFRALVARTKDSVLIDAASERLATGGTRAGPAQHTLGERGDYTAALEGRAEAPMRLQLGGRFPIQHAVVQARGGFDAVNASAALAAAHLMGAALAPAMLAAYPGVRRRQGVLRADARLTVIEDYAHHPTEITALLSSLRRAVDGGRLIVVFQPHRFSRTRQFLDDFARALMLADRVYLLETYGAGEAPLAGGRGADLAAALREGASKLTVINAEADSARVLAQLREDLQAGDLVAFVGAGDIDQFAREWLTTIPPADATRSGWDGRAEVLRAQVSAATKVQREEPLGNKTTLKVGGPARLYVEPASVEDLQAVVRLAQAEGVPWHVLGRGSNLLVPDEGVDAIVVSLRHPAWETFVPLADGTVRVGAGLRLKNLCGLAKTAGLAGFEFLEGIPGNVGGALRMNAGAMGGWMFDIVDTVELMTPGGELRTLRRDAMHVDYRHCAELHDAIALGAVLRTTAAGAAEDIAQKISAYRDQRQKSQPREPSAGCIFKNPAGDSAGRLIDSCGLKGERVGDAEVSGVHGNFIINRGRATSADVIALVRRIRAQVEQQRGVRLQPEVLLYGKPWEDVL